MIESKSAKVPASAKNFQRQILLSSLVVASSCVLLLSGCSSSFNKGLQSTPGELAVTGLHGKTHGGQFPVSGSTVQVYAASAAGAGYNAAATPLGTPVTTDGGGTWTYGSFSCASDSDELYVVSSGGNPGLNGSVNNPALVMTAALGPCSTVANIPFVFIDEVTTVATEYALAGFSTSYTNVGTSSTNTVGLSNAFATVNNLVDITTGQALSTTPAYATAPAGTVLDTFRSIVPYDVLNTLANALASCVNTDGSTNPACSNLFAITGGSLASPAVTITNTADAALYIAQHPGLQNAQNGEATNTAALFNLPVSGAPFGPALGTVPNDYTITVNFVGGGLGGVKSTSVSGAQRLAIDASGNLWMPSVHGNIAVLSNLGAPITPSTTINTSTTAYRPLAIGGYTGFGTPNRVAFDLNGNAWVSDGANCLDAVTSTGAPLAGSPYTTVCGGGANPAGVAVDASNNTWVETSTSVSAVNNSGTVLPNFPVTSGFDVLNTFLGADYTGHVWFIDEGNGHYGAFNTNGTLFAETNSVLPYAASGWTAMGPLAASAQGNGGLTMWITQGDGVENIQPSLLTGGIAINTFPNAPLPGTEAGPAGIAVDGNGNYYFSNFGGTNGDNNITPNITVLNSGTVEVSPTADGFTGGSALMSLNQPNAVGVDQSGNLWVLNQINDNSNVAAPAGGTYLGNGVNASNLTEFVGIAAPVNPVFSQDALNKTYGTKP